jgi:hypothetical protein
MERLKTGVYQDIYNYNPVAFNKIIGAEPGSSDGDASLYMLF